jgi:hypothetical protein
LLRELQALFEVEGLLSTDDVVVVAARHAYPEYLATSVYICQHDRTFRPDVERMGFYTKGAIQREVPRIRGWLLDVEFSPQRLAELWDSESEVDRETAEVAERSLRDGTRAPGVRYAIYVLSPSDDPETLKLEQPVENASRHNGRAVAWVRFQRYTRSQALLHAKTTDELIVS